jgi:hypothetical protein
LNITFYGKISPQSFFAISEKAGNQLFSDSYRTAAATGGAFLEGASL